MMRVAVLALSVLFGGPALAGSPERDSALFELGGLAPGVQSLMLPIGERYELHVEYSEALEPGSFRATLNGKDVSVRFRPAPGSGETVELPLQDGVNVLRLMGDRASKSPVTENADYKILVSDKAVASGPVGLTQSDQARLNDLRAQAEQEGMGLEERSKLFLKEMRAIAARQLRQDAP